MKARLCCGCFFFFIEPERIQKWPVFGMSAWRPTRKNSSFSRRNGSFRIRAPKNCSDNQSKPSVTIRKKQPLRRDDSNFPTFAEPNARDFGILSGISVNEAVSFTGPNGPKRSRERCGQRWNYAACEPGPSGSHANFSGSQLWHVLLVN